MTTLVVDRGEIPDRGMTTARVVEALDEFEHRDPCLGLRLEPAPVEKLAFQRGEEALAHGIVVGVSDRTHRGAHAGLAAAMAELNGRVLTALVGMVDHALRPPHRDAGRAHCSLSGNPAPALGRSTGSRPSR